MIGADMHNKPFYEIHMWNIQESNTTTGVHGIAEPSKGDKVATTGM